MDPASPEDYDDHASDADSVTEDHDIKTESNRNSPSATAKQSSSKPSSHMQKRRRVTRACDECRRKKIKCDGKQPCTHCTVYSYGTWSDPGSPSLDTDFWSQIVHMTNHPTDAETRRLNMSKTWSTGCTALRLCCMLTENSPRVTWSNTADSRFIVTF
jgi:hypothetical protein